MKARFAPLALAVVATTAAAGEIGGPDLTKEAADITVGVGYYYDQSQWDTGSALGNRIAGDVIRDGFFARVAFGLHEDWEVFAKGGLENIENDAAPEFGVSSSGDGFFALGLKAILLREGRFAAGPFFQYSEFSDYSLSGDIATGLTLNPVTASIKGLSTTEAGVAGQYRFDKLDVFGGLFLTMSDADVTGTYNAVPYEAEIEEDADLGAYVGVNYPLNDKLVASAELHAASDLGVAVSLNYLIGHKVEPPLVVTQTEKVVEVRKVVETVYVDKSQATGPARFETEVHFASGSAEVDSAHWVNIRQFAEFLNRYPKSRGIIEGHCDCDGNDDFNQQLSERRARAIETLMVKLYGIDPARLSIQTFGEEKPVASNETTEGKAANRRVRMVGIAE